MELTRQQRNAIIEHLTNQRGTLRVNASRAWNKTQKDRAERGAREIDQLIGVLRSA